MTSPRASPKALSARSSRKSGRPRLLDDGAIERVYEVVRSSSGLRSEQLMKQLPLAPKLVRMALAKLREAKRIKNDRRKRGGTYEAR